MSESTLLSIYKDLFIEIYPVDKKEYCYTFEATEKETDRLVFLKVYDKKLIEDGPKELLLKKIKREEELTQLCKCENVIELYKVLETDISIIFVYEKCEEENFDNYNFGKVKDNYNIYFIKIARSLANVLKVLNEKKVIHRDIKPNNIFLKKIDPQSDEEIEDNCIIKLGDFGSSIKREENDHMQIGTLLYLPPEIIQNEDYDEKCDMWSLGITLYKIYNGFTPYGLEEDVDYDLIQDKIYSDNFIYKFSGIPTLDILFKKLLALNPKERMTHKEFYDYVYSEEFMQLGVIYKENIYGNIYKEIQIIKSSEEYKSIKINLTVNEINEPNAIKADQMKKITKIAPAFDIAYKYKTEKEKNIKKIKFNNILYYNEDKSHPKQLALEIEMFEKETTGKFFFVDDISAFEIILNEIYNQVIIDKKFAFNLIITGKAYEKISNLIKNKYEVCFNHICIFCMNIQKYTPLKSENKKIEIISKSKKEVISKFIKFYSDENTKIYVVIGFITYEEYQKEYFNHHLKISLYYGHESQESYLENFEKMKQLIKDDKSQIKQKEKVLVNAFEKFSLEEDIKDVNEKIINEYSKNTFFGEINRWLRNLNKYSNDEIAYFTSRFMYSLNKYGIQNGKYFNQNNTIYRGAKLKYSSLLEYEKAKGKVIALTAFTSLSLELKVAQRFAKTKNKIEFSTIYYINNRYYKDWISNGIDIIDIARYKKEKEVLFLPFSFYIINDVKINLADKKAEIYLETVGKKTILELEIQKGKVIKYNENLKIIEPISRNNYL